MSRASLRHVDLDDWRVGGARRDAFVRELGAGLEADGFVLVDDPDAPGPERPSPWVQDAYALCPALFGLPLADRLACERPEDGRQRGYTPFGTEHAKDRATADLKEFWQVGRPDAAAGVPANAFPATLPSAEPVLVGLFSALERVADDLLDALALHLALRPGALRELTVGGNSVLRVIHYPPVGPEVPPGAVRAAAHEDINLMTVLPASTDSGLEILDRDGRWLAVQPPPGALIVDTGDMMALLTGGRLPATTHRVVNPSGPDATARSRFSLPYFVHPRPDARLDPLDGSGPGPLAGDFLHERLVAIGVAPPHAGSR